MDETLAAVLRNDFQAFSEQAFVTLNPSDIYQDNWSLQVIAQHLNRCARREITRLIILVPPRSLKSHMATVAFPAYLLGRNPSTEVIAASYGNDLATKFSNDTRSIMKSDWYQELFLHTRISTEKDTQTLFETTAYGARYATSVAGPLTGRGADFIIIDDPLKANDANSESARKRTNEWFDSTVLSRLNDPKQGVIILVMQRLHVDDLPGHLIEQGGWTVLKLPARAEVDVAYEIDDGKAYTLKAGELLHPARLGQQELDERRRSMGTAAFYAQYMQEPIPPAGDVFNWAWFKTYGDDHPERVKLLQLDQNYQPDLVVIDGTGIGRALVQELKSQGFKHITPAGGKGKVVDAESILPMIETGRVRIPNTAPGLSDFRDEVIAFPNGKYCDQVDSMVQLLVAGNKAVNFASRFKRPKRRHLKSTSARLDVKVINIPNPNSGFWFE